MDDADEDVKNEGETWENSGFRKSNYKILRSIIDHNYLMFFTLRYVHRSFYNRHVLLHFKMIEI